VARSGGLLEAAGPGARSFAKGDAQALAAELRAWHVQPADVAGLRAQSAEHLARHLPERVAASYVDVLNHACRRRSAALAA
jgi:hypothetical protein